MNSEDDMFYNDEDSVHEMDDDDDDFVEMGIEPEPTSTHEKTDVEVFLYEVLTTEQIVQHMVDCIKEVNTVVQIPATTTRILLNHFKWDKEKLMDCYYDGDQEKLFLEAHVISPFKKTPNPKKRTTRATSAAVAASVQQEVTCEICYLTLPATLMTGLECGHKFCMQCWTEYLTTKIMDEGMGQVGTISCAAHNCDILVDDATVMKLVKDPKVKLKYQHLITNSFVECNRLLRWCPMPDCGHVVKVQFFDSKPVTCVCSHTFCFACGENWHDPVKCVWLKWWIKKCDDDSETSNWIAANTKECPKCHSTIEKDGGCNHMVCKKCRFDFCWVCLGPWEPHGSSWYNCNRYDEDEAKKARDSQEKSRSALQRYLFYCNRYMNHMQSLKFESKLYASIRVKMEEMQQHNMSWIEVQFLKKAVDVLCQCRQTLMYTYVFAFYLRKNNQSIIFEENQKDLENSTEHLSEYLERDITSDMLVDIKQKVQDKYRYCESRRKVLLDHVHEGYEKELWDYLESA
ncbi:E3 ubiquitin-protein ligase ARIH1 [Lamellibrachia satsuma]|nr:E3 ubiquitin-protein ligase ARIH1 [Lamellibrachia satsuma]